MTAEEEAIRRVLGGEVDAYHVLVERHQAALLAVVRNLLPHASDGEDIAQEAFLAAYLHLGSFDPRRGSFSTWLFRIARNLCLNALKRRRPVPVPSVPDATEEGDGADAAASAELGARLDAALAALPFEQRTAFALSEIHGLTYEEIGRIEDVKLGTVKSRISRAREKLRARLSRETEECG